MSVTGAIMAGVGAASSIGSAVIGSNAAGKAAKAQEDSTKYAADLQKEEADNSLNFQKQVYGDQKANQQPYLDAGKSALTQLTAGTAPGGQFTKTFTADDMASLDPGFDFRMQQGQLALERAEAAGGSIGSGGALKAATQYGQDYASGEFNNAWNRFNTTQNQNFNRLASLAGLGQTGTQSVNSSGSQAAGNVTGIDMNTGSALAQEAMASGNAQASGYMGAANAWGSGLNGVSNSITNAASLYELSQLMGKN